MAQPKKVVVIGGGTGTFVTLSGLKKYPIDLTAIISVADSGGSTGRLRDEFGFQPVGDLRQGLAALASGTDQEWIRKVLLYRFSKGSGLEGHNLGNLILTALQDMTGSTPKALEIAAETFRLHGKIIPITTQNIELVIEYADGTVLVGEKVLNDKNGGKKIASVKTSPNAVIYDKAKTAIETADVVVIGPGDLYGSVMANLIVGGIPETFARTKAKVVYISNLMTSFTQTHRMTAADCVTKIELALGRPLDTVIVNKTPIPMDIRRRYESEQEFPVCDDLPHTAGIIREKLLKLQSVKKVEGDTLERSFIRHDSDLLAKIIMNLIQ